MTEPCSFPAAQVLRWIELVRRFHVSASELLAGSGLSEGNLSDPHARVPGSIVLSIIERARSLTGEPAIGIHRGLQAHALHFGRLGFAAAAAPTMRAAIELVIHYSAVVTTSFSFRLRESRRKAELILDERVDFGSVRDVILFSTLLGMRQVGQAMTGANWSSTLDLVIDDPGYMAAFELGEVRFRQPVNRLLFDASRLDLPHNMHDPAAMRLGIELCEKELGTLGQGERFAGRARGLLWDSTRGFRSLEQIAEALHVSTRTLKRRLAAEDTSYRQLLDEERREQALSLLGTPQLPLSQIAAKLGYANIANFERAFRRWTSQTPTEYRRDPSRSTTGPRGRKLDLHR
ncbi:MAG TPA: AraC family transcriptional regulator ligand-binding domain-containing protein [Polyangiaceae bacterium]|nr:AraC family transcriptional regulator ligand-binding domain-containing protein [Polyangiaceae bacterium]